MSDEVGYLCDSLQKSLFSHLLTHIFRGGRVLSRHLNPVYRRNAAFPLLKPITSPSHFDIGRCHRMAPAPCSEQIHESKKYAPVQTRNGPAFVYPFDFTRRIVFETGDLLDEGFLQ